MMMSQRTKGYLSINCLVMKTHAMEQPLSTQFDSAGSHFETIFIVR